MARKIYRAIGLMSGTSMDGIDAALIETDGEAHVHFGPALTVPYDATFAGRLADCLKCAVAITERTSRPAPLDTVEDTLTALHAAAVQALLQQAELPASAIDIVGFHGHTMLHRPDEALTVQLGDGAALAARTGIDVVSDFRAADVAAGGEGAPLVPVYHRALARAGGMTGRIGFLNVGGVANLTCIDDRGSAIAFDTGPGNALIDDWVRQHDAGEMDTDGAIAATGVPDQAVLGELMINPYFDRPPPKSLDRNDFAAAAVAGMSLANGAATLSLFAARAVGAALVHLPAVPVQWVICGGGRKNRTIMSALRDVLPGCVEAAEFYGLRGDDIEAQAFAFLAVRSLRGLPLTCPGTTGVSVPLTGGVLSRAS